ncbi:HlyD family type I secretion periplasmic adaptor subunit [Albimonas sp. CAU 1670]|uniref:HlyD family type I secretion periplasmic adaptor subunit n=1 Tax=Albimonas sp. CAU 1670 TaxID=3032599 RepID=UPI0023DC9EDB|nr:HlyD family type I secretion periplasmic adaptor subunit [Albimonas sp. CAU 1670]MDF2233802.1 HlyD family type I secretion periplasmic adaptor subunit [Albimonas sp. CAU 1670]
MTAPRPTPSPVAADGVGKPLLRAGVALGLAAAGFGLWLWTAPLSGAVIAEGRFKVEGDVKTVQHLDGGIVAQIPVRDGDRVRAGDTLIRLDASQAEAALASLSAERDSLLARRARLEAERDGAPAPDFAAARAQGAPDRGALVAAIASQQALFRARQAEIAAEDQVLDGALTRLSARLRAQEAELRAIRTQRRLAEENAEAARELADRGRLARPQLNAREQELAALSGLRESLEAAIAETEAAAGEARLDHARVRSRRLSSVSTELSEVVARLAELAPSIAAEQARIARARVPAPASGVVVGLRATTVGGVVGAGEPLMEIVPDGGALVVEARLAPAERERLRAGMPVELRLPGVRSRQQSGFPGAIVLISAELTEDAERSDAGADPTYTMRIAFPAPPEGVALEPGMPVTAVVPTQARTAVDYLVAPLSDALSRSLREL